ncbi:MAG: hypothetical protein HW374_965, partial [Bacteroidetes bacterium]|nr:hypothetical protein [Bacteroidota bacterium]
MKRSRLVTLSIVALMSAIVSGMLSAQP